MGHFLGWVFAAALLFCFPSSGQHCAKIVLLEPPEVVPLSFHLPGLKVASLVDATRSTGATLFYFPKGAYANFDARGGAVAAIETTLIEEGSYSNQIDGIVFSGGSTMGLAATDGVRDVIFQERKNSNEFDFIPSVPGAVVYDYGGRTGPCCDPFIYPGREMGMDLMKHLSAHQFMMGRTGAGASTLVNKITDRPYWGGQGAAFKKYPWGSVFVAVVLNSVGAVTKDGVPLVSVPLNPRPRLKNRPGQNTTLSIVITDVKLDRSALKRLSIMLHTSMARYIHPFHCSTDGDINFAVSLGTNDAEIPDGSIEIEMAASELMETAIHNSVRSANFTSAP